MLAMLAFALVLATLVAIAAAARPRPEPTGRVTFLARPYRPTVEEHIADIYADIKARMEFDAMPLTPVCDA